MKKNTIGKLIAGFLIFGINFGIGLGFLILGWMEVRSSGISLLVYLIRALFLIAYTALFGILLVYIIINTIVNREANKKEKVLLCKGIYKGRIIFVNEKGRMIKKNKYKKDDVEINKYYKVTMTRDYIYKIWGEVESTFVFNGIKPSFWLTFYTPWEIIRDQLWLPIIYALFFIFLPSIIPAFFILMVIVNDLYYKYRVNKRLKELFKEFPDYTFEQFKMLEDSIVGLDALFFGGIMEFKRKYIDKYSWLYVLLIIVIFIIIFFFLWKK